MYGETLVKPYLGERRHQAVRHQEKSERALHAAWLEVGGHEQEQQDRRAYGTPRNSPWSW